MANRNGKKGVLALYASPKCCSDPNLLLYKSYFNIAWFVRAYSCLLFGRYDIVATSETKKAILDVKNKMDQDLEKRLGIGEEFIKEWKVPFSLDSEATIESIGGGFDAQVRLAAMVAERKVDRLLMFQDPDDVQTHLPEAYALIRNCTLANVPLNINAGATFWAETQWKSENIKMKAESEDGFGEWRKKGEARFHKLINPLKQRIAFIAHDEEKPKIMSLIYHYREMLNSEKFHLTGTSGTCRKANEYLADRASPWEVPTLYAAGASESSGHGPQGGDVVIADEILREWRGPNIEGDGKFNYKIAYKSKPPVRRRGLSHVIVFFIDHKHAQPHEADIHVLLRTCIHPSHGVHMLLTQRTALEWAEALRREILPREPAGGVQ